MRKMLACCMTKQEKKKNGMEEEEKDMNGMEGEEKRMKEVAT
jgi:hypothetical protein